MSPGTLKALRLLMDHPAGLYGSEMVSLSSGTLLRGTIYTLLDRLREKGLVREVSEPPHPQLKIARVRYFITADGVRAVREFADQMGLVIPGAAYVL